MIEVLHPDGSVTKPFNLSFQEIQGLVGGYVQLVTITENEVLTHVCCNEDGIRLNLPANPQATERFKGKILMGAGALGTWVVLSGRDLLK